MGGFFAGVFTTIFVMVVAVSLWWRHAATQRSLPCPYWLTVILENPYMDVFAGAPKLLQRAGVKPGMRVLDVGCGPGRLTLPAAQHVGADGEVVALDIQPGMLRKLKERLTQRGIQNVQPVLAGAGDGAMQPSSFDRAFLVTVLGEIPNQERALREIHDALRPGGILSVTEVFPDPHYQSPRTVRQLALKAGFRIEETFGNPVAFTMNFARDSGQAP